VAGYAMKRVSGRIAASLLAAWALFFALPQAAHAIGMIRIAEPSLCIDSMPTDGDSDELEPILVTADGGCTFQSLDIISI
jgi:hypothetical protein